MEDYIKRRVENDPRIARAKRELYSAMQTGNILLVSNAQGKINKLKKDLTEELVQELSKSEASLLELKGRLSEEDYKKSVLYSGAINYCIDWIDLMVTDMNAIINKAFPGGRIEIWDNILKLGQEAKMQLNTLHKGAESMSLEIADNSDDIFEKVLLLIKDVSTEPMPKKGDIVRVNNSSLEYKVVRIDNRRIDKIQVQTQGQLPMWVNQNNINLIK